MSGEKLPLLVIGKSAKPRAFKGAKSLPVQYESNRKAWMTQAIFSEWLKKLDRKMVQKKRKIALILDNCTAHPQLEMNNIKLIFLPRNTTSKTQPCDAGIIQNVKVHYKSRLVRRMVQAFDSNEEFEFNLLDALYLLRNSWDSVKAETIKNCFQNVGLSKEDATVTEPEPIMEQDNIWERLARSGYVPSGFNGQVSLHFNRHLSQICLKIISKSSFV